MSGPSQFKDPKPPKKKRRGRARPTEPLRWRCEICGENPATERHHKLRRSQGGGDEQANTLDLCDGCHDHIHANPGWAYRMGYLVRSGALRRLGEEN